MYYQAAITFNQLETERMTSCLVLGALWFYTKLLWWSSEVIIGWNGNDHNNFLFIVQNYKMVVLQLMAGKLICFLFTYNQFSWV